MYPERKEDTVKARKWLAWKKKKNNNNDNDNDNDDDDDDAANCAEKFRIQ